MRGASARGEGGVGAGGARRYRGHVALTRTPPAGARPSRTHPSPAAGAAYDRTQPARSLGRLASVFRRIDHIGVAVAEIEASLALWRDGFQMEVAHREVVEEQGVEAVLLDVGENHVELLAPLGEDTPVGKFLAKKGPGLHHVAYQVGDIDATLASLKESGMEMIDEQPRSASAARAWRSCTRARPRAC